MTTYIALLRGINVGGNSLIKMTELKACFEKLGFEAVTTYIQSGNVVFRSAETHVQKLAKQIEESLKKIFAHDVIVVLLTHKQIKDVVAHAPKGFGKDKEHKYNVAFVKEPATPKQVMAAIVPREDVDALYEGPGVMYYSTVWAEATKSRVTKIVGTPIYKSVTIRNWNTTVKMLALAERAEAA